MYLNLCHVFVGNETSFCYKMLYFIFQGLLWALAVLFMLHENDESAYNNVIKTSYYSDHQATELAILGTISMTITIINVVCIYVVGYSFLKVKYLI